MIEIGQGFRLGRAREIESQLAGVLRGRDSIILRACNAHAEEQQVGCLLESAEIRVDLGAGLGELAVLELEIAELVRGFREIRADLQRLLEIPVQERIDTCS